MLSTKRSSTLFKFFFTFLCASCVQGHDKKIAVKVGTRTWTFKEIQNHFQLRINQHSFEDQNFKQLKKEILNEILLRSLIENWAKKQKIQVSAPPLPDQQNNFLTYDIHKIRALRDHKNYLHLYHLFIEHLLNKSSSPSFKQQKNFYNANKLLFREPATCHLRQILVDNKRLALALKKRLNQGEDFDKLSLSHSLKTHPGWVKKGTLKVFDQACYDSHTILSPVLKSPYGYHIFLVGEKKAGKQKTFAQVKRQIIKFLKNRAVNKQFQTWLKQELTETPVFINKGLLDTIHIQYKSHSLSASALNK